MSTNDSQSFPLSTRQALINKAKSLSPSSSSQQYSSVGWSNRVGSALTPAAIPGVYTADRPFLWNNIDVGCRMTVIELESNGGLWIHSPVGLDGPLRHALEQLNQPVKHVVSPNYEHVKFASQWHRAFPDAKMWGCPGLMERLPEISWAGEIPNHCRPPTWTTNAQVTTCSNKEFWDWNEIQPLHIDIEVNPFTNKPFFNEVVYYHTPSKTLMTTDFYWNYPKADGIPNSNYRGYPNDNQDFGEWELAPQVDKIPIGSRLWKVGMDKVFYPFYMNFMVKSDQQATFQDICTFLIHTWEIDTVIPAHGDIVRGRDLINSIFKDFFKIKK
jgi:hypothetical protein